MKKKIIFTSVLFITLNFIGISQEEKRNTIDSQFTDLIENSSTYLSSKVIQISNLNTFHKSIQDSIASLEAEINGFKSVIAEQKNKIDNFTHQIKVLKTDIEQTQEKVENINFLGVSMQKAWYNSIMWSIIFALMLISIILFFVLKKDHSKTKETIKKIATTEIELESLRKRSLEREQKIRRELQDEINKNRLRNE